MLLLLQGKFVEIILLNMIVARRCRTGTKNLILLLFFSGLIHMRWVIISPHPMACKYFILYSMITAPLFFYPGSPILILNLAGLPPLTGFFMKIGVLALVRLRIRFVLLFFSAVVVYAYLRIFLMAPIGIKNQPWTAVPCGMGVFF